MAQILPYQRQVTDAPGLGFQPSPSMDNPVARGLASVASGLGNVDAAFQERDQKAKAAQSSLALATFNNDARDLHDEIARGVEDGSIPTDKAIPTFRGKATALRDKSFSTLSPEQQAQVADNALTTTGGLTRNLNVALYKRNQSEAASTIDAFGEQAQRSATRIGPAAAAEKFAAFVDFQTGSAGLSPERAGKLKQSFTEGVYLNAFQSAGVEALTKMDAPGLAEVRKQLMGPDGEAIDPQKRMVLQHQLFGYEQHVLAKQAAALNAADNEQRLRDNAAATMYNQAFDIAVQGKQFEPAFIKSLTEAGAGTAHEQSIVELLGQQSVVSGFATKPEAQRTAILERLTSGAVTAGTNPEANKTLKGLLTLNDQIKASTKENPWASAQASGVIANAPAFDASKPDSAFSILQQRNADIAKVEQWAGTKISPFQPQEIAQLSRAIKTMPPDRAAPYIGQLGQAIGDFDRINMVADELDKSNKPLALALKLGTDRTSAGRAVTEFVLRGAQGLADKTIKRDDAVLTGWRSKIAGMVRGTLGDQQTEDAIIDASYYTRAAFDLEGIEIPGFPKLDKNEENAIKMVAGTPIARAGVKTLLPRGMDENQFDDKLKTYTPEVLKTIGLHFFVRGQVIRPEQLSNRLTEMGMTRSGSGKYTPVSNGAYVTLDAAGAVPLQLPIQ